MSEAPLPDGRDVSAPIESVIGIVTLYGIILLIVPLVPFVVLHGVSPLFGGFRPVAFFLLIVVFTLAHEGFHVFGWKYWGSLPWRDFEFGFKWEALAPYAHAKKPMRVDAYRLGTVLPLLMTGLLPYVFALVIGDGMMTLLGTLMISAAVGDLYVLWTLRDVSADATVVDHPENVGCIIVDEGTG
jgi:hypothetical protein